MNFKLLCFTISSVFGLIVSEECRLPNTENHLIIRLKEKVVRPGEDLLIHYRLRKRIANNNSTLTLIIQNSKNDTINIFNLTNIFHMDYIILKNVSEDFNGYLTFMIKYGENKCVLAPSSPLHLIVARPPNIQILEETVPQDLVNEGTKIVLTCRADNGRPPPKLVWFLDNQQLTEGIDEQKQTDYVSISLSINMTEKLSQRVVRCVGDHAAWNHPYICEHQLPSVKVLKPGTQLQRIFKEESTTFKNNVNTTENYLRPIPNSSGTITPIEMFAYVMTIVLIVMLGAGLLCHFIRKQKKSVGSQRNNSIYETPGENVYSYVPVEIISVYAARALVAENRRLPTNIPFVPALPCRDVGASSEYEYIHALVRGRSQNVKKSG